MGSSHQYQQQQQIMTAEDSSSRLTTTMITHTPRCPSDKQRTTSGGRPFRRALLSLGAITLLLLIGNLSLISADQQQHDQQTAVTGNQRPGEQAAVAVPRSTQASVERQLDTPAQSSGSSSSSSIVSAPSVTAVTSKDSAAQPSAKSSSNEISSSSSSSTSAKPTKPKQTVAQQAAGQRKYLASQQQNYDKYQLKATNSQNTTPSVASPSTVAKDADSSAAKDSAGKEPGDSRRGTDDSDNKQSSSSGEPTNSQPSSGGVAHKKAAGGQQSHNNRVKTSSFSLLKKLLPSFMTSAGPAAAAAAAAAASAVVDRHQMSRSRSSSSLASAGSGPLSVASNAVGSFTGSADGPLSRASGKLINYILSGSKKSAGGAGVGAVPDHAPFFIRKPSIDRQAGFASGLLSNPLSLGLLFSAPLIPSLLLTPLAIAGLSPAMSAINNFFGDDEEANTPASNSPLSSLLTGSSSPLSAILQNSGSPFLQAAANSAATAASGSSGGGGDSPRSSLALQAVQSFLGPTSTTEKPLFNPGMFASQGIQNAMANLGSSSSSSSPSSSSSTSSGSGSGGNNGPLRNFLGGNFIQTAASMISPSFAAPPSGGSSSSATAGSDSDDGPGLMEMASSVFDKVSSYMNTDNKDSIATASSKPNLDSPSALSSLVGLSSFSPFQLSSLFASSPLASAIASSSLSGSSSSSGHNGHTHQRAGFFSTLKNVYELFSSSFLRRQADVGDSNECQQRLICELHQRAMNSKLFRRSVQANLMELANLDRNLQEQIKSNPIQARVDADTKAMLNDFLKASNNFKSGRDVVDCGKMFPKCSRAMLLSTANTHLMDPKNGKAIGKFSNFMKKMKFKTNQQHQSQWKLRKPAKTTAANIYPQPMLPSSQYQATDYLQVAPMTSVANGASSKPQPGQLAPVDSLKLIQQIMMMSQQAQQQQAQQQPAPGQNQMQQAQSVPSMSASPVGDPSQSYMYQSPSGGSGIEQQQQQQGSMNQMYSAPQQMQTNYQSNYPQQQQYSQSSSTNNNQATTFYTDAIPQQTMYSSPAMPTSSPYYSNPSQSSYEQQMSQYQPAQYAPINSSSSSSSQQQLPKSQEQPQLQTYQQYSAPSVSQTIQSETADKKPQQQLSVTGGQQVVKPAAAA